MAKPWRIIRFEDAFDSSIAWAVPEQDYEWESTAALRVATASPIGRDHAVDLLGWGRAPRDAVVETVRCSISAPDPAASMAAWDAIQRTLDRIGRGRLWAERPDGTQVWAWARLRQPPAWAVSAYSWLRQPIAVQWLRLSPWWEPSESTDTWTVTVSGQTRSVPIGGTTTTERVVIRLTASAAGGYANPTVADLTTGTSVTVAVTAPSAGAILELDCERRTARQSTDGGATWADVTASVAVPAWQIGWVALLPGTAVIELTQQTAPAVSVQLRWVTAYAG